ncbi:MAG: LamG domain-containing protein, partial [Erysipelothrix sp.]|nr:LamG domain-containing protein [Erysipelothrix sp.]
NTYSVSMWLKPEVMSDFSTTFFGAKNNDSWISFTPQGVGSQAVLWSGTNWYDGLTNYVMTAGMWTHVAFTVDNGKVRVYINGDLMHTGSNFPSIFSKEVDAAFGLGVNYWDTPYKGIIDELQVHTNRVMSAKDILAYYDSTVGDDRFVRNINKVLELPFENSLGAATVTGDRLDTYGGSVSYREGVVGQAVYLDGNSGIKLPNGFLTSSRYSFQMWVNPETVTAYAPTFFGGSAMSSWVNLPVSGVNGRTMFWSGENWYDALSSKTIPSGRWSHLAVSVDNGSVRLYIDGELEFSGTDFPDIFNSPNSFAALGVNYWDTAFNGMIDEFKLYNNTTLSSDAIKSYYEETAPDQDEFERNQEKTHIFKFEDNFVDDMDETLEGYVVGSLITEEDAGSISFVEGQDGQAAYFDGTSGIRLPDELITSENYSVALWVNPETVSAHSTTFFGSQTAASWLSVVVESGEFTEGNTVVWSGENWFDGDLGSQIPVDTWSHIAFTVNEGVMTAYLNGEQVFEGDEFPDIFVQEESIFALGVNYWDTPFNGMIDEVMVFDSRVLSADEVGNIVEGKFDFDAEPVPDVDQEVVEEVETTSTIHPAVIVGGGVAAVAAAGYGIFEMIKRKKELNI